SNGQEAPREDSVNYVAADAHFHRSSAYAGWQLPRGRCRHARRKFAPLGRGRRMDARLGKPFCIPESNSPPCLAASTGGFSFGELFAIRRSKLGLDLSLGLAITIGIALFAALAAVVMSEIYPEIGESLLRHANDSLAIPLPAWFFAWSVLVSPLGAALVEELTYRGYALPRLTAARL